MRNGEECEVYGFDDLGTDTQYAEGFDLRTRGVKHWNPENGKIETSWLKKQANPEQYDIVGVIL